MLSSLLNILWVVLGGLMMALGWWLAGLICAITVVGLPWARSCFVIGRFSVSYTHLTLPTRSTV